MKHIMKNKNLVECLQFRIEFNTVTTTLLYFFFFFLKKNSELFNRMSIFLVGNWDITKQKKLINPRICCTVLYAPSWIIGYLMSPKISWISCSWKSCCRHSWF